MYEHTNLRIEIHTNQYFKITMPFDMKQNLIKASCLEDVT